MANSIEVMASEATAIPCDCVLSEPSTEVPSAAEAAATTAQQRQQQRPINANGRTPNLYCCLGDPIHEILAVFNSST
jgi:hypothetical protein